MTDQRGLLPLLALTCGVAVGNVYFPQATSPLVAAGLHVAPGTAAAVVTATQFGYAAGIFFLVPLGDRLPYRRLVVTLLGLTGLGPLAAAAAPTLPALVVASAAVGVTTVVAPILGALAAGLVPANRRGAVGGTLLSGALGGMLLSRTVAGALGERLGWRALYLVAAGLTLLTAALLSRALPPTRPPSARRYPALLAESIGLLRTEPELRRSCLYQTAVFTGFSAVWGAVALLFTGPAYHLGTSAVGTLALVNAITMVSTPVAGRQVDRRGSDTVNVACLVAVIGAAAVLAIGGAGGVTGLAAVAAGTLLLDVAMQAGTAANVVRLYALRAEIRNRLNTVHMTCAYLGGSAGSWLGVRTYGRFGWPALCALVALLAIPALAHLLMRARGARAGLTVAGLPAPGRR
ncbi:MAG: MFS transporter [Mycobacteriales bacterium]